MLEPGTQYSKSFLNNNRVRKTVNRQKISLVKDNIYLSEKQREERCKELLEKRGNRKYTNEGIIARLFGEYLVDISENSKLSKDDMTSFVYGYYSIANRQIYAMCQTGQFTDFIKKAIKEKTKLKEDESINLNLKQLLFDIGYRDSYDENLYLEKLSDKIKNNEHYFEGYMTGIEEQKGKKR